MVKGLKRLNEILSLKISYLAYKLICIFLICQFLFLPFSQQALAFDAQTTHRILTEKALRIKVEKHKATGDTDFLKAFGDINEEGKLILTPEARKIINGSEEEDYPELLSPLGVLGSPLGYYRKILNTTPFNNFQSTPFMSHFYNPKTEKGLLGLPGTEAPIYANTYTYEAVKYYQGSNCQPPHPMKAFYVLGRALHIIEDMATPAHVTNDIHLPDWLSFLLTRLPGDKRWIGSDNFEEKAKKEIVFETTLTLQKSLNPSLELSKYTYEKSTFTKDELKEIYGDRFIETEGKDRIEGVGVESYDWWQVGTNEEGEPLYYIENVDQTLYEKLAPDLLSRAVEYTAGEINSFWDQVNSKSIWEINNPGCDHPDDNSSVSTPEVEAIAWELEQMLSSYYRLAIKKDKKSILSYQKLLEEYKKYLELAQTGTTETLKLQKKNLREVQFALDKNSLQLEADFNLTPDIALLRNGFYEPLRAMILKRAEPIREIDESFSPSDLRENPILIIPSGGLYGLEKSDLFKAKLEEFVKQGGTLICLSQQRGYEYKALPGSENLSAYGWREDQSCQGKAERRAEVLKTEANSI